MAARNEPVTTILAPRTIVAACSDSTPNSFPASPWRRRSPLPPLPLLPLFLPLLLPLLPPLLP